MTSTEQLDRDVRLFVYGHFVDEGAPPSVGEAAAALATSQETVEAAFRRLEAARVLVFAPGTLNIWMANPLCAHPTPFWVETARGAWWGTCVWDALGIPAMLGIDGVIASFCADCSEPLTLRVEGGELRSDEGVAHFAVPARQWWENIAYT